jgi:hypothetical protein
MELPPFTTSAQLSQFRNAAFAAERVSEKSRIDYIDLQLISGFWRIPTGCNPTRSGLQPLVGLNLCIVMCLHETVCTKPQNVGGEITSLTETEITQCMLQIT